MATLDIQQWNSPIDVGKATILESALRDGVPYPHGCRNGKCGNCKTRVLSGEVDHGPYFKEALSDSERDQGMVLACCSRPKGNVRVAWIGDAATVSFPVQKLKAKVIGLEQLAHNVTGVRLQVRGKALKFAAGQYARLKFGNLPARSYSMANRPDEDQLEFHVRQVANGSVSGFVSDQLKVGDVVRVEGPFGSSNLREDHDGRIVAIGGGTGLAPMLSIVRTALAKNPERPINLYFGVQDEVDVYAVDSLEKLALSHPSLSVDVVLSMPASETLRRTGYVHSAVENDFKELAGSKIYTAGPPPMVDAIKRMAAEFGVGEEDIHTDPFVSSADEEPGAIGKLFGGFAELFKRRNLLPVPVAEG